VERWSGGLLRVESALLTEDILTFRTTLRILKSEDLAGRPDKLIQLRFEQDDTALAVEEFGAMAGSDGAHLVHKLFVSPEGGPVQVSCWNSLSEVTTSFEISLDRDLLASHHDDDRAGL
jgi:hypothetical protein